MKTRKEKIPVEDKSNKRKIPLIFWQWLALLILCSATEWGILYWVSNFMRQAGGVELAKSVYIISFIILFQILGRLLWTHLSKRHTVNSLLFACTAMSCVGISLFYIFTLQRVSFILLVLFIFVFSIGISGTNQLTTVKIIESSGGRSTYSMSCISFASGLSVVIFPWMIGSQSQAIGIEKSFLIPVLCSLLAFLLCLFLSHFENRIQESSQDRR